MYKFLLAVLIGWAALAGCPTLAQQPAPQKLSLSLSQAIDLALKNNIQARLSAEAVTQSRAERALGRSALLPNVSGAAYQMNLTMNLAALGLPLADFPGLRPLVGPFNNFDARFELAQSVFNLASIRRYRAAGREVALAGDEERLASQQVMTATAVSFLTVLEAEQAVVAMQSNVQLAGRLVDLANSQRQAGIATGMDVARAETRLASQQVRLAQARANLDSARLNLLRIVGAPLSSQLSLTDTMRFAPEPLPDPEKATAQALADRLEIRVAADRLGIAEEQRKAASARHLPSVSLFGNYGSSGLGPNEVNLPTRVVGLRMDVPLFDGGRTRSEVQLAASLERQAELRLDDLRTAVEKDVREAVDNLATREDQVRAAQKAVALAERELELAQDRFQNGVADNIEVLHAQTALEDARQALISSLAQFNVARLNLASALGHVADFHL
jgi:outer membrane protein TolC